MDGGTVFSLLYLGVGVALVGFLFHGQGLFGPKIRGSSHSWSTQLYLVFFWPVPVLWVLGMFLLQRFAPQPKLPLPPESPAHDVRPGGV